LHQLKIMLPFLAVKSLCNPSHDKTRGLVVSQNGCY
jgi:hypothetical protein